MLNFGNYSDDEVICPFCQCEQSDSWELGDGGEGCGDMHCGSCGEEFTWSRGVSVHYKSAKPGDVWTPESDDL